MTRPLLRITLLLLLGAATTVAVAWGCWLNEPWSTLGWSYDFAPFASQGWEWHSFEGRAPGSLVVDSFTDRTSGSFEGEAPARSWSIVAERLPPQYPAAIVERAYGWPAICVFQREQHIDGLDRAPSGEKTLHLIVSGSVINTLFYAVIWFGVFFGFTAAKRAIRRRRGRCPQCGYDLRGQREDAPATASRGCPECGWNR